MFLYILSLLCTPLWAANLSADNRIVESELNIYSARKEALIKPLLDKFSAQYDVKINLVTGKADAYRYFPRPQYARLGGHKTPSRKQRLLHL